MTYSFMVPPTPLEASLEENPRMKSWCHSIPLVLSTVSIGELEVDVGETFVRCKFILGADNMKLYV